MTEIIYIKLGRNNFEYLEKSVGIQGLQSYVESLVNFQISRLQDFEKLQIDYQRLVDDEIEGE
jgi:hypothetical protein